MPGTATTLGVSLAAACATFVSLVVQQDSGDDEIQRYIAHDMPSKRDYSFVALPTSPPPGDAYVVAVSFREPVRSGQEISFQYREFTLYACSKILEASPVGACRSTDKSLIRKVRKGDMVTVYAISSKFGPASGKAARLARRWVESEDTFVVSPDWVDDYAAQQLERKYGK